jgi:crotonobetaine/carnitine-CoA ligase
MSTPETIGAAFAAAAAAHGPAAFLAVPANPGRDYLPEGLELSYAAAGREVASLAARYRAAGYGVGHRVATLLENRPEAILHKLALNSLGVCCVPVNPDYRPAEIAYLLGHSKPELVLALASRADQLREAMDLSAHVPPAVTPEAVAEGALPAPSRAAPETAPDAETPSSILYTSGTTGRPKGCVLSHGYELAAGARYASLGGVAQLRPGRDRVYNPLPLYHVNAGVLSLMGVILTGNCQVQPDRFGPRRWWREIAETRATIAHYLGVIAAMLMAEPPSDADRAHGLRVGIGAGIEPTLHAAFEARFGLPMAEIWGMTEMVRILCDSEEPRQVGTRAFGRAIPGVEARVEGPNGAEQPDGTPGELLIRHSEATPRRHFFSGYLDDPEATEAAWRGGWFHTGDQVWRGADGMLHFMDRLKNIIRRSGENIAAAEVEAVLLAHEDVVQAAVLAVPDEIREEEVLACVVLRRPVPPEALVAHCLERMAYFKAPGWILVVDTLPTTATQKIQKHAIFGPGTDPRLAPGVVDLRGFKRR